MLFREPNVNFESNLVGSNNVIEKEMNIDINMAPMHTHHKHHMSNHHHHMKGHCHNMMNACQEMPRERCIQRTFVHEVPHVCPIHTRVINHHVYKHTYRPVYTCNEENVISNVQCGSCNDFR